MIAVTGEPRSGTSLAMMVIRELGYRIAGKQFVNLENKDANPDGVWELPRIAKNGLSRDMAEGKTALCPKITEDCIKLMSYGLVSSDQSLFNKVVVCVRHPYEIIKSQIRCGYPGDIALGIMLNYQSLMEWLAIWNKPFHVLRYNDLVSNPKWHITGLSQFLGNSSPELIAKAVNVVNPNYYRNKVTAEDFQNAWKQGTKYKGD